MVSLVFSLLVYVNVAACVLLLAYQEGRQRRIIAWLSKAIHVFLVQLYPIKNHETHAQLSSLPYIFPNGQGNVEKFLQGRVNSGKWASQYGSLYRLWSGFSTEVVLTQASHVEIVFKDSHKHTKAHANDSGWLMEQLLGQCLGLISGEPWRKVKAAVETPFLHRSTSAQVQRLREFAKRYIAKTMAEDHRRTEKGITLHPVRDLKFLPFLFVAESLYGELSVELEKSLVDMVPLREGIFRNVIAGGLSRFSFSQYLPLAAVRELRAFKDMWGQWNDCVHAECVASARASNGPISVPPIVDIYASVAAGDITREQLLQTLDEMLFANLDVTMGGLSWPLVFLAAHSNDQEDLRAEIKMSSEASDVNAYLHSSFTSAPSLLSAVILESARLRPLAAFSVPQSCPTARDLDGYMVPAGTKFVVDSYALNIRDRFWGEDRERFRPRRWLDRVKAGRDLRYRYWRFGFGPRVCLGKNLAEMMLRVVVVELVEQYSLRLNIAKDRNKQTGMEGEAGEADWPWDDETWIHHPDIMLECTWIES